MKRIALILAIVLGGCLVAQGQQFEKSTGALNVGIGIGSGLYSGPNWKMTIPPISISYEHGITEKLGIGYISVGGYVAISGAKQEWHDASYGDYGYKYTYIVVGPRAAYHFDLVDVLDLYAGVFVGAKIVSSKTFGDDMILTSKSQGTGVAHSEFVGIRYYFTPLVGVFAEVGYGVAYLTVGAAFKF